MVNFGETVRTYPATNMVNVDHVYGVLLSKHTFSTGNMHFDVRDLAVISLVERHAFEPWTCRIISGSLLHRLSPLA